MERITQKDLEILVERINIATDSPVESYIKTKEGRRANIGNYHLCGACGGVKLERMCDPGGGVSTVSTGGFGTKRELYNWMSAFLAGLSQKV